MIAKIVFIRKNIMLVGADTIKGGGQNPYTLCRKVCGDHHLRIFCGNYLRDLTLPLEKDSDRYRVPMDNNIAENHRNHLDFDRNLTHL